MSQNEHKPEVMPRVERLISRVLLAGVVTSMTIVFVGLVLMFVHHPDYLRSAADLARLTKPGTAVPDSPGEVFRGIAAGRGQSLVALGLMMLIATPIARVAIGLVGFALERDRIYAAISAVVLTLLAASFWLGR